MVEENGVRWWGLNMKFILKLIFFSIVHVLFKAAAAAVATAAYWWGADTKAADLWKWTLTHLPSRRCHIRVSSDCSVWGMPFLKKIINWYIRYISYLNSMFWMYSHFWTMRNDTYLSIDCTTLTYAMAAASSPRRWTYGLTMLTFVLLLRNGFTENINGH